MVSLQAESVEIVGETRPLQWNEKGTQVVVPHGARDSSSLSHTTESDSF